MGLGGISIWQLLIVLAIVVLLFGTKKLSSIGSDVGGAVKGFRKAMTDEDGKGDEDPSESAALPDKEADGAATSTHARKTDKTS